MEFKPKVLIASGAGAPKVLIASGAGAPKVSPFGTPQVGATTIRLQGGVDTSAIPEVSLEDVTAALGRSKQARSANDDILKRVADGSGRLNRADIESMLARAGVETTDVKMVLAYHARHSKTAFDDSALTFLCTLDWSDVSAAHVEELKRQNQEQVESFATFKAEDKRDFDALTADDNQKMLKVNDEKGRLQKKSDFELEGDFAAETSTAGLDSKEAFLLLAHRKRFTKE